jgi:hypothetical protein
MPHSLYISPSSAGYGGAVSVYFGLDAGLQLLDVSLFKLVLQSNELADSGTNVRTESGNAYGGGISVYMGGYASVSDAFGSAKAAVGETVVRNASVVMESTRFTSCRAMRSIQSGDLLGASAYGGSFSFYIGAYAWSRSTSADSSSTCAATTASGLSVRVSDTPCSNCIASTTSSSLSYGANSFGGSLSVLHVGAYAWSRSASSNSSSTCAATTASGLSVRVSDTPCSNCVASTASSGHSNGANSFGGSLSVMYIGAYAWSRSFDANSSSTCAATTAISLSIRVSDAPCSNCNDCNRSECRCQRYTMLQLRRLYDQLQRFLRSKLARRVAECPARRRVRMELQ